MALLHKDAAYPNLHVPGIVAVRAAFKNPGDVPAGYLAYASDERKYYFSDGATEWIEMPLVSSDSISVEHIALAYNNQQAANDRWASYTSAQKELDATQVLEGWSNLSAWANSGVSVSDGKLYSDGGAGPSWAAAKSVGIGAAGTGRMRILGSINVLGDSGGYTLIGVGSNTADTVPTTADIFAIGVRSSDHYCVTLNGGVPTAQSSAALATGTYYVSILIDENWIYLFLTNAAHGIEYAAYTPRSGFDIKNVVCWNSDSRTTSGNSIGPIGYRESYGTLNPRTGYEGITEQVFHGYTGATVATERFRVMQPASIDTRTPMPLVLHCHGSGETDMSTFSDTNERPIFQDYADAGYLVAASNLHGTNWGNDSALSDLVELYRYCRDHWPIGPVILSGISMGGLAALTTINQRLVPGIVGAVLIEPVCSLASMYSGWANTAINAAYNIPDGGTYATLTAGHDPLLVSGRLYRGIHFLFVASADDVTVLKAQNTDPMRASLINYAASATLVTASGPHGDATHFNSTVRAAIATLCARALKG